VHFRALVALEICSEMDQEKSSDNAKAPTLIASDPSGNELPLPPGPSFNTAQNSRVGRSKVPLPPGRSQMDWVRLLNKHGDLAGNKGNLRKITIEEVRRHNSESDAWIVLRGKVYNATPYLEYHPGGKDILARAAGRDVTALFNKYHAWVNSDFIIGPLLLGILTSEAPEPINE